MTNNWTEVANWTGDVAAPGANDIAVFNATSSKNCIMNVMGGTTIQGLQILGAPNAYTGTITLNANLTVTQNVIMQGATIAGPGTLTISNMTWTGGTFTAGAKLLVNTATSTLTIEGNVTLSALAQLDNKGIVYWKDGNITLTSNGRITNNGTGLFQVECNREIISADETGLFTNLGNVLKPINPGLLAGITTISAKFNNQSNVSVSLGTVNLRGGGSGSGNFTVDQNCRLEFTEKVYTFNQLTSLTGAGTVALTGNGTFSLAQNGVINSFVTFEFGANGAAPIGTMTGEGEFHSFGLFRWFRGSLVNLRLFHNHNLMDLVAQVEVLINSCSLHNSGTITWTGAAIDMTNQANVSRMAQINNTGTFNVQTIGSISIALGSDPATTLAEFRNNGGTFALLGNSDGSRVQVKFYQDGIFNVNRHTISFENTFSQTNGAAQTTLGGAPAFMLPPEANITFSLPVIIAGGTLDLGNNGLISADEGTTFTLTIRQIATLKGGGLIDGNLINEGTVDVGGVLNPARFIFVSEDYTQTSTGRLRVGIGAVNGDTYNWLDVGKNVTLAGTLEVYALPGVNIAVGDEFAIIRTGMATSTITGTFLPPIYSGFPPPRSFAIDYGDVFNGNPAVTLTVV